MFAEIKLRRKMPEQSRMNNPQQGISLKFLNYLFLIEEQFLYNTVLVSAIHRYESAIGIGHSLLKLPPISYPIPAL